MNHICLNCSKEYESPRQLSKWCSTKCQEEFMENAKDVLIKKAMDLFGLNSAVPLKRRMVEKGTTFDVIKQANRVDTYWKFSRAMFWPYQEFHEGEVTKFKRQIECLFAASSSIDDTFIEYVEKACLAKRHIEEKEDRFIPQPQEWFDTTNPFSISCTEKWYKALQRQRSYNPSFNSGFQLFAQAILRYADTHNILDIPRYRKLFLELTHYDLLQWYFNVVMHLQFIEF